MHRYLAPSLALCVAAALMTTPAIGLRPAAAAKSAKQCRNVAKACKKSCDDTLIDVGNNIKDCKDRCDDKQILCFPTGSSSSMSSSGITGGSGGSNASGHGVIPPRSALGVKAPPQNRRPPYRPASAGNPKPTLYSVRKRHLGFHHSASDKH
jgi:hypothetical protein